jgi:hypothetical protein
MCVSVTGSRTHATTAVLLPCCLVHLLLVSSELQLCVGHAAAACAGDVVGWLRHLPTSEGPLWDVWETDYVPSQAANTHAVTAVLLPCCLNVFLCRSVWDTQPLRVLGDIVGSLRNLPTTEGPLWDVWESDYVPPEVAEAAAGGRPSKSSMAHFVQQHQQHALREARQVTTTHCNGFGKL